MNKYYQGAVSPYVLPGLKGERIYLKPIYMQKDLPNILRLAAEAVGEPVENLLTKSQKHNVVLGRQLFSKLARQYTNSTMEDLAEFLKRRDHSNISNCVKKINERIETDDKVRLMYRHIELQLI